MTEFLKIVLEHAEVLSAGIAGLLIFGVLVVFGAYKLMSKLVDRQNVGGSSEVALKAMQTLALATQEFADSADRQSNALSNIAHEVADSRRECSENHKATQTLLAKLLGEKSNA